MSTETPPTQSDKNVAQAYLEILHDRGVRFLFGNGGTDFAPIIESYARMAEDNVETIRPIAVPHEMVAVSMAHGYYMISGQPQLVMLHVSVGTSNALTGIINAARNNVSMLVVAGRTPITEQGRLGCRDLFIHWGQECFDQGAMVREFVKWDYELRGADQLETVLDRALQVSLAEPRGPVYLSLPREILAETAVAFSKRPYIGPDDLAQHYPDPAKVEQLAGMLAAAQRPLIITTSAGASRSAAAELASLAEKFAIPVVVNKSRYMNLATNHPCHLGFNPHELLAPNSSLMSGGADLIIVVDSDVPWFPARAQPPLESKVVHLGIDPHFVRYPIRGFRCDLAIPATTCATLKQLTEALSSRIRADVVEHRRSKIARIKQLQATQRAIALEEASRKRGISMIWATHCLSKVKAPDSIVINEYSIVPEFMDFDQPCTNYEQAPSGGLGWALGAALGAKLAAPDRDVIVATGDGNYMFCAPVSAHHVAQAQSLPFLTVVFNNSSWNAVKAATQSMYPDGQAKNSSQYELSELAPSPAFEKVIEACGGWGVRVDDPEKLEDALRVAIEKVRGGVQSLVNVILDHPPISPVK